MAYTECRDKNCGHLASVHKKKRCTVNGCRCAGLKMKKKGD